MMSQDDYNKPRPPHSVPDSEKYRLPSGGYYYPKHRQARHRVRKHNARQVAQGILRSWLQSGDDEKFCKQMAGADKLTIIYVMSMAQSHCGTIGEEIRCKSIVEIMSDYYERLYREKYSD